jgi:dihydrofolate reductase
MRKLISSLHVSLDGFVAGQNGELDWIKFDDELFDFVGELTNEADVALYGHKTFQLMESYWPTAADKHNATKHEIEHSQWYNKVDKYVLSTTLQQTKSSNTKIIGSNEIETIYNIKQEEGKNILMFGSPSAVQTLLRYNLIDEFWLFVNPIILGNGIPLFKSIENRINLKILTTKVFVIGVIGLHYSII